MSIGTTTAQPRHSQPGEPVWELAMLYPPQGSWTESAYLALESNLQIEFVDGRLAFLPMPTDDHQRIVFQLQLGMYNAAQQDALGTVRAAPLRMRIPNGRYREPDVLFVLSENDTRRGNVYWDGADIVVEVVSPGDESRSRDFIEKRSDYALAGVSEYWIVDPETREIHVLRLREGEYVEGSVARPGDIARSTLLPGFDIDVAGLLAPAAPR